jgi:hypothetical protein
MSTVNQEGEPKGSPSVDPHCVVLGNAPNAIPSAEQVRR